MLKKIIFASCALALLGAGCTGSNRPLTQGQNHGTGGGKIGVVTSTADFVNCQRQGGETTETYPRQCQIDNHAFNEEDGGDSSEWLDEITVSAPLPVEPIMSPLVIHGEAVGGWYSEAVFPVWVTDADGNEIGRGQAHADDEEWMTEDMAPFTVTLTFTAQTPYSTGFIVFHNDNPSGEPSRDKQMMIPVTFGN